MSSVPERASSAPKQSVVNWVLTLLFNVALPLITYNVLADHGVGDLAALLASSVWPALQLLATVLRARHVDEFSIFVLILMALGIIGSLVFNSPRLFLIKEAAVTGLFGVVLLGSLLFGRPLMFYFGRKFATDGSREQVAHWNGLWHHAGFRRFQRVLTLVWGASFAGEALLRIVLTYLLPIGPMVVVNNVLPLVVLAALIFGTIRQGRKMGEAAERRRAAEEAGTTSQAHAV
ncbi:MAG: hypothetical protein JOZ47_23605 [Kutzneria sp.]|nr:hypothetical protein [Kutzneria sp.]